MLLMFCVAWAMVFFMKNGWDYVFGDGELQVPALFQSRENTNIFQWWFPMANEYIKYDFNFYGFSFWY